MHRFVAIDEEGYFLSNGIRSNDETHGQELFKNLKVDGRTLLTDLEGQRIFVEAFDAPYVVQRITPAPTTLWQMHMPYGHAIQVDLKTLNVDDWDRFVGQTSSGVNFVLSRAAQMQLFNLVDEFDDDGITVANEKIAIQPIHLAEKQKAKLLPPAKLSEPLQTLTQITPQIKLPRSRICLFGVSSQPDAQFLSSQGHIVTTVEKDFFQWAKDKSGQFDIIFENGFYNCIEPDKRTELVHVWRKLLAPGGHLLGVFSVFQRLSEFGYGTSEWEVRERLKKDFDFLYWTRWKTSPPDRLGTELVLYAQKRTV